MLRRASIFENTLCKRRASHRWEVRLCSGVPIAIRIFGQPLAEISQPLHSPDIIFGISFFASRRTGDEIADSRTADSRTNGLYRHSGAIAEHCGGRECNIAFRLWTPCRPGALRVYPGNVTGGCTSVHQYFSAPVILTIRIARLFIRPIASRYNFS